MTNLVSMFYQCLVQDKKYDITQIKKEASNRLKVMSTILLTVALLVTIKSLV